MGQDWAGFLWRLVGLDNISMGVDGIGKEYFWAQTICFRISSGMGYMYRSSFTSKDVLWIGQNSFISGLDWSKFPWEREGVDRSWSSAGGRICPNFFEDRCHWLNFLGEVVELGGDEGRIGDHFFGRRWDWQNFCGRGRGWSDILQKWLGLIRLLSEMEASQWDWSEVLEEQKVLVKLSGGGGQDWPEFHQERVETGLKNHLPCTAVWQHCSPLQYPSFWQVHQSSLNYILACLILFPFLTK